MKAETLKKRFFAELVFDQTNLTIMVFMTLL